MNAVALLLSGTLVFGGVAYAGTLTPLETSCGTVSGGNTRTVQGIGVAQSIGNTIHQAATDPALRDPALIKRNTDGFQHTLYLWLRSAYLAARGEPEDPEVTELKVSVVPASCTSAAVCAPDGFASTQGVGAAGVLTGADLAADALRRAGFSDDEIPTFVAIAEAESGFNPKAWNDYGAGMAGMWQLNQQYWQLADWQDPYANAVMAKRVRDEAVAAGHSPYQPWSTRKTAEANADRYARFSTSAGSTPQDSTTGSISADPPACEPGGSPDTVGSWNVWYRNSPSQINASAGFADLVGLQEIRHNSALHVPGYGVTDGKMAVPIIWKLSKLELVKTADYPNGWKRETVLEGYARDKSAVSGIWRNKQTGKVFAAINTHELVQGGVGWEKQAKAVNRIRAQLVADGYPVVLTGDMNAAAAKVAATFGGTAAGHHIDYAIGYGGIKPARVDVLSKRGSDHSRILVTLPADKPTTAAAAPAGGNVRTVTSQGKTYRIPIPAGEAGVAINYALDQLGKPYVWAAHGPNSFDCSGLVSAAWKQAGESVFPQTEVMSRTEPRATGPDQPGDLWGHFGHVQMYLGVIDGKPTVVEAANPRDDIRIDQSGWMNVTWKLRPTA